MADAQPEYKVGLHDVRVGFLLWYADSLPDIESINRLLYSWYGWAHVDPIMKVMEMHYG